MVISHEFISYWGFIIIELFEAIICNHTRSLMEPTMNRKSLESTNSNYHESPKSSLLFTAQARSYEKKIKSIRKIKNPFEPEDPAILEENTCSPGILIPGKKPEHFSWSIDDISRIQPANIDSPIVEPEEYDEGKESMAQEAIAKYFSSTHSIVSPVDAYQGTWRSPALLSAPNSAKTISSTPTAKCRMVVKNDASSQTNYSFPPVLPVEVEEILKPYFSEVEVQGNISVDSEDQLMNGSSLKRKLFFEGDEDLSPVKYSSHLSTPSPRRSRILSRIEWSGKSDNLHADGSALSSPDVSPIRIKNDNDMSLGSHNMSCISNAEAPMMSVGSFKCQGDEEMAISMEDHNRIFSSTVMSNQNAHYSTDPSA